MLPDRIEMLPVADFHVHLRQGRMMELVVPTIRRGGANVAYVMVCRELAPLQAFTDPLT